jgi:two-component system response regulator HydG
LCAVDPVIFLPTPSLPAAHLRRGARSLSPAPHHAVSDHPVLLVMDDDPSVLETVERLAAQLGFAVRMCADGAELLATLESEPANLAVVNAGLSDVSLPDLVRQIRATDPDCDVVLLGGAGCDWAIEALQRGAREVLTGPFDPERLRQVLNHRCEELARRAHIFGLEARIAEQADFHGMIGRGPAMQEVFDYIQRLAPHARHVLIRGETGTGKELAAHAFHEVSAGRARAFITVNCSTGSELLSGGRGAGPDWDPFEAADGGTLFLDEIAELSGEAQDRLLKIVDRGDTERVESPTSHAGDMAIVAATNRDLGMEVAAGRFSERLFECLNPVTVSLPPLRNRREDIPYLTAAFVSGCAKRFRKTFDGVTPAAERLLLAARWDGNVRELRNALERACMLATGRLISDRDLDAPGIVPRDVERVERQNPSRLPGPHAATHLGDVEREHIVDALRQVSGNRMAAAKVLGISRRALYRRLARHHITGPAPRQRGDQWL